MTPSTASGAQTRGSTTSPAAGQRVPRRRRRWTNEQKQEWLQRFLSSGRSLTAFCQQAGLSVGMVSAWRRRQRTGMAAGFAQVRVAEAVQPSTTAPVVVQLGGRVRLCITPGTDPVWLGRLLQQLGNA